MQISERNLHQSYAGLLERIENAPDLPEEGYRIWSAGRLTSRVSDLRRKTPVSLMDNSHGCHVFRDSVSCSKQNIEAPLAGVKMASGDGGTCDENNLLLSYLTQSQPRFPEKK